VKGDYPVVIDKSHVSWHNLSSLKYEDQIHNFHFPICTRCKGQIRTRRNLNNQAIKLVVVVGTFLSIILAITHKNIGFSIFFGFCVAAGIFALFVLLKKTILNVMGYASESSWGSYKQGKLLFRVDEFEKRFSNMNCQDKSLL